MILMLVILSVVSLLLAGAIELWWGSPLRQQQKTSLAHLEKNLAEQARHVPASSAAVKVSVRSPGRQPGELITDALCLRAGLPVGWRMPIQLVLPGLLIAVLGAWRIGSVWAAPLLLAVYAALLWLWLRSRIEKQRQQLVRQLPDFLDSMVRLASIGNSLPMAFQTSSTSVQMPLRVVLERTMQLVRTGFDLDRALETASRPYRIEALNLLHVVMGTGIRMGGRADHILQRMSDFMRDLSSAQQELRAITAETRMSAWVLGLLPLIVAIGMSLLSPQFFQPMLVQPLGHKILLIAALMELFGGFLLYRLAKSL